MRELLKDIEEKRATFTGTFVRLGIKNGYKGPQKTVLLKDSRNNMGKVVSIV